ncbi:hypothetical protein ACS0TY_002188 [Phlomoides rotata]
MCKLLPGTGIVVNPHINSKLLAWKKDYGALSNLLLKSGIGWNSTTSTLDIIDESVWDEQKMDRAIGEHAVNPIDLVNFFLRDSPEDESENRTKMSACADETDGVDGDTYVCKSSGFGMDTTKGKKRKGTPNEITILVDMLGEFMKNTDDSFNALSNHMGPKGDSKVARTRLNDIMKRFPCMSLQDKLKVNDELVCNTVLLDFFLSIPHDEQAEYVWMLLDGKLGFQT